MASHSGGSPQRQSGCHNSNYTFLHFFSASIFCIISQPGLHNVNMRWDDTAQGMKNPTTKIHYRYACQTRDTYLYATTDSPMTGCAPPLSVLAKATPTSTPVSVHTLRARKSCRSS